MVPVLLGGELRAHRPRGVTFRCIGSRVLSGRIPVPALRRWFRVRINREQARG
jgi:hypothetical protein